MQHLVELQREPAQAEQKYDDDQHFDHLCSVTRRLHEDYLADSALHCVFVVNCLNTYSFLVAH